MMRYLTVVMYDVEADNETDAQSIVENLSPIELRPFMYIREKDGKRKEWESCAAGPWNRTKSIK